MEDALYYIPVKSHLGVLYVDMDSPKDDVPGNVYAYAPSSRYEGTVRHNSILMFWSGSNPEAYGILSHYYKARIEGYENLNLCVITREAYQEMMATHQEVTEVVPDESMIEFLTNPEPEEVSPEDNTEWLFASSDETQTYRDTGIGKRILEEELNQEPTYRIPEEGTEEGKEELPDKNCNTTPDGGCVGSGCMHDPDVEHGVQDWRIVLWRDGKPEEYSHMSERLCKGEFLSQVELRLFTEEKITIQMQRRHEEAWVKVREVHLTSVFRDKKKEKQAREEKLSVTSEE